MLAEVERPVMKSRPLQGIAVLIDNPAEEESYFPLGENWRVEGSLY
jgi:hypothetical protein